MPPPQRRPHHGGATAALGAAAACVLTAIPLLDFLSANTQMLFALRRLVSYYTLALGAVVVCSVTAYLLQGRARRVRLGAWLVAWASAALVALNYHEVRALTGASGSLSVPALSLWGGLLAGAVALPLLAARAPRALAVALVLALALTIQPALVIIPAVVARQRAHASEQQRFVGVARLRPNIYWIVLDGYPRGDVLREQFGTDDADFQAGLRQRGFFIQDAAIANYPLSITSIAATLSGQYLYTPASSEAELQNLNPLYPIVRGNNAVVARLKSIGYRYVHFANGYDFMTLCSDAPDRCVLGSEQLDEVDVALLSRTPYFDFVPPQRRGAEDQPFIRGAITDLTDKLVHIGEVDAPRFVYAHLIVPHPPLRFDRNCTVRAEAPDLLGWDAARRPEFVEQVACAGTQTLQLLDTLLSQDPEALIVVQSDHGPAFNGQLRVPVRDWSDEQVKERFAVLSAMRFPPACSDVDVPPNLSLVNTFPLVFSCLSGTPPTLVPDRSFIVVSHEGDARLSGVVEIARPHRPQGAVLRTAD